MKPITAKPTAYGAALLMLAGYYKTPVEAFQRLPRLVVLDWAAELPNPELTNERYRFLIGEDQLTFHRTKLIERLSASSLAACATATGRTVQRVCEAAGVRV